MRVYLGSDHAGFELKQQIIEHLKETGHEPIDCGAFSYDPEDDYPAFCIAADAHTRRPGQLGHRSGWIGQRRTDRREQGAWNPMCIGVERRNRITRS